LEDLISRDDALPLYEQLACIIASKICGGQLGAGKRLPTERAAMVELAWLWLRWQPDSALSIWFRARVTQIGGRIKKIMIVALARKLLVALSRYVTDGVIPDGARMKTA
jgi:hypothetical protein